MIERCSKYLGIILLAQSVSLFAQGCLDCHPAVIEDFAAGHRFAWEDCTVCHSGQPSATEEAEAHAGMIADPGNPSNMRRACGSCHPGRVKGVRTGLMATGKGMVSVTRYALRERSGINGHTSLAELGHSPADSLLRKLCAGCHLGHDRDHHRPEDAGNRGGGCLACHLTPGKTGRLHPRLTVKVGDERCFGCHARSARISLNYPGLAEVDEAVLAGARGNSLGRLEDGRLVERKAADIHHWAGLSCIDCHTGTGLMQGSEEHTHREQGVDIACPDCHRNHRPRLQLADWPDSHRSLKRLIPFPADGRQEFLVTGSGTPLWHVKVRPNGVYLLYRKVTGGVVRIPQYSEASHPLGQAHGRLTCAACHSQWAPQCYGCHLSYDPEDRQWDHVEGRILPGRWSEVRWAVESGAPTLGVNGHNRITPFVPGMIFTADHPDWEEPRFARLFAPLSPHTTGSSRACVSCHRSSLALGLGKGILEHRAGEWVFHPDQPLLQDGLPADAWTTIDGSATGKSTRPGSRPYTPEDITRILNALD